MAGFSLGRLHMGGGGERFVLPTWGTSAGEQSVNGGRTHEGDIDLMERDLTSIDYVIN